MQMGTACIGLGGNDDQRRRRSATDGPEMARAVRHPGLFDASGAQLAGRLLDVAGCETYVVDAPAQCRSSSPPVLLLHGYGDTADALAPDRPAARPPAAA